MIMLGIDVSKTKIDCCIFPQGLTGKRKNKIFTNTESGFASLLKWLITLKIEPDQVTAIRKRLQFIMRIWDIIYMMQV